jgi:hypothetical protein
MFADFFSLSPAEVRRMSVSEFEMFRRYADAKNQPPKGA